MRDHRVFALDVFLRDGDRVFLTYATTGRGVEALGSVWTFLDLTPFGRQEEWEDTPARPPADAGLQLVAQARRVRGQRRQSGSRASASSTVSSAPAATSSSAGQSGRLTSPTWSPRAWSRGRSNRLARDLVREIRQRAVRGLQHDAVLAHPVQRIWRQRLRFPSW